MSDKHFKIPLITKFYGDKDKQDRSSVTCATFGQNGEILATGSIDNTVRLWLLSDLLSRVGGPECFDTGIEWVWKTSSADCRRRGCRSCPSNGSRLPVEQYFPKPVKTIQTEEPVYGLAFHRTVPLMAINNTSCIDLRMSDEKKWHLPRVAKLCTNGRVYLAFAFHPTEPFLVTCSIEGMKLWKLSSSYNSYSSKLKHLVRWGISEPWERGWGEPMSVADDWSATCVTTQSTQHDKAVTTITFHPNAPIFATTSVDRTAKVWLLSSENSPAICVATLTGHRDVVLCAAFHSTAVLLATGSSDATIKLWRLSRTNPTATCVATLLPMDRAPVYSVAFHPTSPVLATTCGSAATLWLLSSDNSAATCVAFLEGHEERTFSIAFHPNGNILCTTSQDGSTMLWDCSIFAKVQRKIALTRGGIEELLVSRLFSGDTGRRMPYQSNFLRHKLTQRRGPYLLKNVETPARRATATARRLKSQQRAKSASPPRARPEPHASSASSLRGRSASPKPHSKSGGSSAASHRRVKHYASNTKRYRRNRY